MGLRKTGKGDVITAEQHESDEPQARQSAAGDRGEGSGELQESEDGSE